MTSSVEPRFRNYQAGGHGLSASGPVQVLGPAHLSDHGQILTPVHHLQHGHDGELVAESVFAFDDEFRPGGMFVCGPPLPLHFVFLDFRVRSEGAGRWSILALVFDYDEGQVNAVEWDEEDQRWSGVMRQHYDNLAFDSYATAMKNIGLNP